MNNQKLNEKTGQSGRSMVEMLGVLAIIGVLSVGAISGYRHAMNRHEANQIINNLTLTATIVSGAAMQAGGSQYLKTKEDTYEFDLDTPYQAYSLDIGEFYVDIPPRVFSSKAVCEMALTGYTLPYKIIGNNINYETPLSESDIKRVCTPFLGITYMITFAFFDDLG